MAYNTKPIVTDKDGNPISQYYNTATDEYEPVEGSGGGNKVVLYNADGTENNSLSLLPILDKLSQLTGTVIDEETRKSNELQRIELYNQIFQMLQDGELRGDQGIQGIKGETGLGLEFNWQDTSLGVRIEGEADFVYVDLKGDSGSIDNLSSEDIEGALGYTPADSNLIGLLASLTTEQKTNLVAAINEVNDGLSSHEAESASKHIKESGSNANGKYIKFDDGTMICTHYMITEQVAISTAEGVLFTSPQISWAYPATFVGDRPSVSIANNNTSNKSVGVAETINISSLQFRMWRPVSDTALARHISLMAVGRWKA